MMYTSENVVLKEFSNRVKALRKKHNLSQSALGGKAELEKSLIQRIERGSNVTLKTLIHLANGFNISLSELLDISLPKEKLTAKEE